LSQKSHLYTWGLQSTRRKDAGPKYKYAFAELRIIDEPGCGTMCTEKEYKSTNLQHSNKTGATI